ncbi:putative bacterial sensory transduction regulator [Anaerolinea thermolimosa]|uniref:YbjN domain-containing protein n=1 Tax=Anaerolinea thermolimosa TaxID=229919 RepID=UPI000784E466|nr:YbjN domain-containing protein [Anaerolinea thermolimosa]GAP07303.1 putative bacterial sensory transduction regulator [Anaerolinea thermolimosa]
MGRITETAENFFLEDGWPVIRTDNPLVLRTSFEGKNGLFSCIAQAREEQEQFVFYSIFPVSTPMDKLNQVVEFITRANYGLIIGNFEVDLTDGEIRFKTSVDLEGGAEAMLPLIRNVIYANVLIMDRYFSGLLRVMYGGISPEEAVQEIEGSS